MWSHAIDVRLWLMALTQPMGLRSGWMSATKGGFTVKTTVSKSGRPRVRRQGKPSTTAKDEATRNNRNRPMLSSSERKSIEELAAEQGVSLEGQLDRVLGAGADLWASDEEFEEFVHGIYDRRREGLNLGKR
jgi:hypothetical protein